MAKTISQQVLDDFMATLATNPNADRKQLMQAFPEFGNDEKLLDAAYDYRETRLQNPMADMQTINSKFPEFFGVAPTDTRPTPERHPTQQNNPIVKDYPAPTTEEEYQESLRRQDAASGATNDPNHPFVEEEKKQPNAFQTFYKGLGAGAINTANGLLGFLNRANSAQLANDPMTLQMMDKQGMSPEEIAQAADATRARLDKAENERYEAWKKKADQLSAESKPDRGEKSFTDYLNPKSDDFNLGKALQLGLGTAAESLPYTASAINPVATAAMIMSMSEQNYRQSLIDNPDMSDGQRLASAAGNAAIEMAVEHIGNPFKVFKAGKLTAPTATKWIKDIVKQSKDNIYKGILRVLGFGAKEAAKEGGEEVITTAGQDLYNTLLDWKDTNGLGLRSQWERAKQNNPNLTPGQFALDKAEGLTNDFIGGALSGMMMSGPSTGIGIVQNAKYYSKNGGSEASRTQAQQQLAVLQQLATEFDVSHEEVAQAIVDLQAEKTLTPKQQALINRGEEIITNLQNAQSATQATELQEPVQETTPLSPAAAEHQRAVDEVTHSVRERTHGNGYIYPVAMPGNAEKTGFIVGEVVPVIDESNPEQLRIENDDVVTVKWSDGTVTQERARDLDLTGAPMIAQQAVDIEVENQMYAYTQQRIQNGEQPVLMRNKEGILEGFFPAEGGLLEDQNGVQYTPEQLAEQGWQETKPVLFVNDTQQIAALDNGDGTYTQVDALGNPIAEPMSAEAFREQGFAMVPLEEENPKSQAPVGAPIVQQAPVQQAPEVQQPEAQEPAAPVVPNIETMSAADYAGAAVEYMGSREYVDEYLDGEIKKVQQQLDVANRKKVGNVTDMADFKAKKDAIEAEKKALQGRLDKLTEAREKAKSYLTIAEREQRAQAEAERKAAEEAARIAREQAMAAEAARLEQERIDRELKKGVPDFSEDNDRDARARGFHVVNGQVIHRQEPLQPLATGKAVTVQFAKGQNGAAEAHHVLIPVSMAQPSHINGQRNPAFFISEAQPKDRRDQVSKVTSDMMAQNIHPDEIVEGATAYVGAPVVNGRGEAVQGNNRLDALIKMYQSHPESVAKYKQYLIDNAEALGYTEIDIETIRNNDVIDVRMLDNVTDEQAIQLGQKKATDLETGGVQLIDPQVTANQLGDRIQRFSEILLRSEDDEATLADLTLRNGRPALEFLQKLGIISDAQMQSAFDSRGNLTAEAKAALQGVLKQVLFQNAESDNLPIMFDDIPVTAQKAILQTIVRDLQSPEESRLVPDIQEAIGALYRALHQSAEVKNGRNEQEIRAAMRSWALQMQFPSDFDAENFVPSEKFSNFALELATLFKYGKQTEIAKALNAYYDAVQGTTGSLFEDTPAIPYNEAVKQIFNIDYERKREVGTAVADNSEAGDGWRREQPAVDTNRESGSDESRSAVAGTGDNAAGSGIRRSAEGTGDTGDVTQAEREEFISLVNQYLTSISSKETKGVLFDNNSMVSLFRKLGFQEEMIQAIEEAQNEGNEVKVRGFNHNGVVFLNVDAISTPEDARNNYVHERQHSLTLADSHWLGEVMKVTSEEELTDLLNKHTKNHYYNNKKFVEKADEFISYAMEIAYSVANNEELERALKDMGANDALINIIKSINDEQRKDNDLSLARRTPFVDGRDGRDSQQDGGDRGTRAETGLEPEGAGSAESGTRGAESGAEQVTPFKDTPLGKVVAEVKQKYPGDNVAILFREGDNYEIYDEDAVKAAPVLGLELSDKDGIPFVSFPSGDMRSALTKLIGAGIKIGISRKPDHKPTKGDYQIGDSLTYNGKTATIQDFTYFGTVILDVEGRRVEVSKEQLDDILDYGDYMYHVGDVVTYNGKRAQIVEFASGEPVIEVEGESEKRYVSFSDIERVKKETPTEDNAHLSDNKSAFVAPQMPIDTQTNAQKQSKAPTEEEQQQAAQYLNEALQEVISKSGDKLPQNITIDESTIEDNPNSAEMTARLLIDGKPSDFSVTIFDQSLGARGGFDPVNMVKFYPREELDKWDWDLADRLAEEFNKTRTQESGLATVMDESDAVYFFNMQAALDFAEKARQEIAPTDNRETSETPAADDPRFSISGTQVIPVGEKTLVGLHNISAEKLRKAIKMGGLANPSTAVIDIARQNHEQYGDISLVMPSSLVDSKTGRNAGTFTSDIWSPTYPSVERIMSDKGDEAYYQAITKAFGNNEARRPILSRAKLDFDDYLDSGNIRAGLAYWYLLEKGIEPGDVYFNSGISDDIKERFRPLYDKGILDLTKEDYRTLLSLIAEQQGKTAEDMLQDAQESKARYQQTIDDPEAKQFYKKIAQQAIDEIDLYGVRYNVLSNGYHAMERAIRNDGKIDLDSTLIAAQDIVQTQHQADFDKWLSDMDKRFDIKEVLFEDYDRDGNRIYKPHTLANASRMMNKEDLQNAGDHSGLGATRGQLVERMETLADIRANKGRLRPGAEEDFETEEWNKMQDEWFNKVLNPLSEMQKISDNPFSQVGYAETRLQEALRTKDPIATLNKEYGYKIDPNGEWAKNLKDLVQRIKSLPTKYFETKFRRPVYLDEFANAVVPVGLPQDLRDGLTGAGMTLFEYDPAEQGSRRAATLKATADDGIRFSISGNTRTRYAEEMELIKNEAVNNGTFMQAPNGKPTNLTERQWLQVRLHSFKRWFGDWENDPENASKVLDVNGEPMVVYHRTNNKFTQFDPERVREQSGWPTADFGFYFSNVNERGHYGRKSIPVFLNIRNPREIDVDYYADFDYNYKHADPEEMRKDNDGLQINIGRLILDEKATKVFVAPNPNQIKSATNNDGSFSEENDDIRFAISNQNNDIFYSNAERAVEGIKQDKATPEQWRAMIEKAGGLKAGEDKWIGLSDWLAQQRPTVTPQANETRSQFVERAAAENKRFTLSKQDLLDYIREHKIQIEETEYGEASPETSPRFREFQDEVTEMWKNVNRVQNGRFNEAVKDIIRYEDDLEAKYGEDFRDMMDDSERNTMNYLQERRDEINMEVFLPEEVVMEEMCNRHGDDFQLAFSIDDDGSLSIANEDAAGYYLDVNPINDTRLQYTTEGLTNKHEIAMTVPTIEAWNETDEIHFGDAGEGRAIAWVRFGDAEIIEKRNELEQAEKNYGDFIRSMVAKYGNYYERVMSDSEHDRYYELGQALASARRTSPTTKSKVLVIDEIQSKRHQEGREKGYREISDAEKERLFSEVEKADSEWGDFSNKLREKYGPDMLDISEEDSQKIHDLYTRKEEAKEAYSEYTQTRRRQIPAAPFEKNWHELAMKRILRFAAENGYDKVAWTTGDQQAARYDIGKVVDLIEFSDWIPANEEENDYGVDYRKVVIRPRNQMDMWYYVDRNGNLIEPDEGDPKTLAELVGKDLARNIVESSIGNQIGGEGLRIGGEGMRGFYDDILPRFMQKYGKKWGVQVGEVTMPQLEDGYQTMHAIDINDAMRESVLEGQPMFSISGRGVNGTMKPQEGETRSQYIARVAETVKNMTPRNTTIDDAIRFSITVNHNSPYLLKRADGAFVDPETGERLGFDHRFMGTGEGGQSHGWGTYLSVNDLRKYADQPLMNGGLSQYFDVAKIDAIDTNGRGRAVDAIQYYLYSGKPIEEYLKEHLDSVRKAVEEHRANGREEVASEVAKYISEYEAALAGYKGGAERHHYSVEIPDNTGSNYLEEGKMQVRALRKLIKVMTDEQKERLLGIPVPRYAHNNEEIMPRTLDYLEDRIRYNTPDSWRDVYEVARVAAMSDKGASELLRKAGFVGIHYDGRRDGECYVIFDENDAKITNHFRFSISGSGTMKPQPGETRKEYIERVAAAVRRMTPRSATIDDAIRFSITVNHNSPYLLKKADGSFVDPETGERLGFDHRFMSAGEGNQAHGWGSYFSVNDLRDYAEARYSNRGKVNTYKGMQYDDVPKTLDNFVPRMILSELGGEEIALEMRGEPKEAKFRQAVAFVRAAITGRPELHDLLSDYYRAELADEPIDNVYSKVIRRDPQELADELLKQLDAISMSDFQIADRHHYSVEIPDNDGTNYIEERQPMNARARKAIMDGLIADGYTMVEKDNGEFGWYEFNKGDFREDPDNQISLLKEDETYGDFIHDNFHGYNSKMLPKISEYLSKAGIVGIHYDGRRDGECYVIFDENDAVITDHIRFSISNPSTLSRSEMVTKALVQQANNNYNIMQSALKKVTADLKGIRAAMRMQSDYDRKVVDALLNLYNTLLQENGVWAQYMPDTTRRIATQIVHAIGKQNITEEVNTIMDHMVHAQAKAAQRQWDKLRQTPIDKINISGVVMQGKVALEGQYALKALNEVLDPENGITLLTLRGDHTDPNKEVDGLIDQLMQMEDNATDESQKLQYKGQWIGYEIAAQYLERIQHIQEERKQLDLELKKAQGNMALKPAARKQLVESIKQAMRDNYLDQADAYMQSTRDLQEYVSTQEVRAKDFIRRQDANRDKIRSYAQRDLEGLATNPNRNRTRGNIARQIWDAFASPIRDLQSLLRLTGLHAPDGEGYLYNHFMRNWMDGADKERTGIVAASKTLDEKIAELTHGKYKTWEEAARKINDASHNMFTITMLNGVDGKDMPVTEDIPLSAGNALYIYAVNKMNDGRMKLNGMNITEEDVQALADKVREQFGQEILDVVDWVQSEFFSQLRNRYNPTHEALFGAPMDAIENYFPLRINAAARQQNEDLSEPDTDAARLLAGTSTGAIKRRTKNSLPLDVRNADFFQEVIRHIAQMERWNAFAQWNRDANILFSDINFRNRIKGMRGTIYGSGDQLYNYMKNAFRVAIGTYKPKTDTFSEITLNVAKGVTSAKINFRIWTALKQIASFPAFFTYMTDGVFVGSYLRNWLKPHETMKWARENLPNFEKRVSKRDMGDMRLMQRSTDWQWNKRVLEWSRKYGMATNVYFDTLTCATGARAVYDSRLAEYLKKGYPQEQAEQRARQDAELAFNTSQQSSEGAFMSAVQMDRNIITAALTVFRTSPIQYTRNFFYHTRNLLRKFGRGSKEEQIAFRMGQYKNDGLTDEQARKAAEKDYNKSIRSDIAGFVVYGALLNILWRLVGQVPYLLFGDDDDKKKEILGDATSGGAWFSPFTGLLGGGIVESALDGNGSVADMFAPELPFTQDVKRAGQYLENDKYAEFANQALSVAMQSGTGFDPQTAGDMIQRIVTTIDSEEELSAAEQALRISQALLSIPQSQYEQQLIDRVVAEENEYDAALEDYIRYQKVHTAPLTWWMRGEESDERAEENAERRFDRLLNERDVLHNPEEE